VAACLSSTGPSCPTGLRALYDVFCPTTVVEEAKFIKTFDDDNLLTAHSCPRPTEAMAHDRHAVHLASGRLLGLVWSCHHRAKPAARKRACCSFSPVRLPSRPRASATAWALPSQFACHTPRGWTEAAGVSLMPYTVATRLVPTINRE
jgi:hypothetical protein